MGWHDSHWMWASPRHSTKPVWVYKKVSWAWSGRHNLLYISNDEWESRERKYDEIRQAHSRGWIRVRIETCVTQALVHQKCQIRPRLAKRAVKQVFYEFRSHRKSWGVVERRDQRTSVEDAGGWPGCQLAPQHWARGSSFLFWSLANLGLPDFIFKLLDNLFILI